ncbi:MAG: universal stress protein [Dermatophilus congolensis]|nr:universal stress protein [Dermatophilus congolensis]
MSIAVLFDQAVRGNAALVAAAREALLRQQPLYVVHIVGGVDKPDDDSGVRAAAAALLADFEGLDWHLKLLPEGVDTAESVLRAADEFGATLLVMGAKRRRAIGKLLLGSTVQRLLLNSHIDVLVVRVPS